MEAQFERGSGQRVLLNCALAVIVITGLKAAGSIVVPVLVAAFLAILFVPAINRLQAMGLPDWVAVTAVFLGVAVAMLLLVVVVGRSFTEFQGNLPAYGDGLHERLQPKLDWIRRALEGVGVVTSTDELAKNLDARAAVNAFGKALGAVADLLSNMFFVILTVAFILGEAAGLPRKLRAIVADPHADLGHFGAAAESLREYQRIKTRVSLVTGVCAGVLVAALGIDHPFLWGLTAFLLNFVPTVGSMIAAAPPVLLAFVQFGWQRAAAAAVGYVVINLVMGNVVEPRVMGRKLGLSSLVVFLSLVFWGWVWGPIGMLLSVPLTMIVKILLEHSDDMKWIAILLGPGDEQPALAAAAPGSATPEEQPDHDEPEAADDG